MVDLISTPHTKLHNEWIFITCLLLLIAITFLRIQFGRSFWLINKAAFTQRYANQFLRETNNLNVSFYLLPIFIIVLSMYFAHPCWNQTSWSILVILKYTFWISFFLLMKYFLIRWVGHVFQQQYIFEEVIFLSFLFENVAGLLMYPFLVLSIYASFDSVICLQMGFSLLFLFVLYKLIRILYFGFFKRCFSKTHLFVYLCTIEIIPLIVVTKHFLF